MGSAPKEVFVYGTLLPGQENHRWIAHLVADSQAARTRGRLFHLPYGYPAMVESDEGWVRGEILSFRGPVEQVLEVCDKIEGYNVEREPESLFIRVVRQVEPDGGGPREAWCYCLAPGVRANLISLGQEVMDGDWVAFVGGEPNGDR